MIYHYDCQFVMGVPTIWQGGGQEFLFEIWTFICREAMRFARGVRGHAPPPIFFKWCNLVRFGVYFDQILSIKIFKNTIFYIKILKIAIFYMKE